MRKRTEYARGKTGYLGVTRRKSLTAARPFKAQIRHGKKQLFLGYFETAELAHQEYLKAEKKIFGYERKKTGV